MSKIKKDQKLVSILIHLPESIKEKLDNDAKKEMRDRKNHIQKILTDYVNKLPA